MTSLQTEYMGIELKSPIIVGACSLSRQIDTIKEIESAGAGALVVKSLFEEAIQLERGQLEAQLEQYDAMYSEAISMFPSVEHGGPTEHLYWIEKARKTTKIPLIASLNCLNNDVWVDYAGKLCDTGVDGLELNFYSPPIDPEISADGIEKRELETFAEVREAVKIPIAVKLHPNYTNMMRVAMAFDKAGADALVLFNRLFQPDLDIKQEAEVKKLHLSSPSASLESLRWMGLLHGKVKGDLVASGGVFQGEDVVKMLLAGATAVQVVSTVYRNKIPHVKKMNQDLRKWMKGKGYESLEGFRGKVSKRDLKDAWAHERGQYIKALLGFD